MVDEHALRAALSHLDPSSRAALELTVRRGLSDTAVGLLLHLRAESVGARRDAALGAIAAAVGVDPADARRTLTTLADEHWPLTHEATPGRRSREPLRAIVRGPVDLAAIDDDWSLAAALRANGTTAPRTRDPFGFDGPDRRGRGTLGDPDQAAPLTDDDRAALAEGSLFVVPGTDAVAPDVAEGMAAEAFAERALDEQHAAADAADPRAGTDGAVHPPAYYPDGRLVDAPYDGDNRLVPGDLRAFATIVLAIAAMAVATIAATVFHDGGTTPSASRAAPAAAVAQHR